MTSGTTVGSRRRGGAHQPLGVQPLHRLAHRRARHAELAGQALLAEADVEGELAVQQEGLEGAVGGVTARAGTAPGCCAPFSDPRCMHCCGP